MAINDAHREFISFLGYSAVIAVGEGAAERALTLLGAIAALHGSMYDKNRPYEPADFAEAARRAYQMLDRERADQAWATGQRLTPAQALMVALRQTVS